MERLTERPLSILAGLLLAGSTLLGQSSYTVSAKPGAVNYTEGTTTLNGNVVSDKDLKATFLNTNDVLATHAGKAEVLLTPGVFLRVGDDTEIRMLSASLINTKVEVLQGEIMVEATGLVKDNNLQILDHGAEITITKNGLYKFTAGNPPVAAVLDGRAKVTYDDRSVDLKKGRETVLAANLKSAKFDTKAEDDLYAWSNVRSEYDSAASYRLSRSASLGAFGGGYGLGTSGFGPGWYWDNGFNSYAWLPGYGSFYSPFGYGFYSPGLVGYAPVINTSVYRGGAPWRGRNGNGVGTAGGFTAAVPVNPSNPGGVVGSGTSPWANREARREAFRTWATQNPAAAQQLRANRAAVAAANGGTPGANSGWHGGASAGNPGGWHGSGAAAGASGHVSGANSGGNGGWHGGGGSGAAAGGGFHGGGASGAGGGHGGGARSK